MKKKYTINKVIIKNFSKKNSRAYLKFTVRLLSNKSTYFFIFLLEVS